MSILQLIYNEERENTEELKKKLIYFSKSIEAREDYFPSYVHRAMVQYRLGNYLECLEDFKKYEHYYDPNRKGNIYDNNQMFYKIKCLIQLHKLNDALLYLDEFLHYEKNNIQHFIFCTNIKYDIYELQQNKDDMITMSNHLNALKQGYIPITYLH